MPIIIAYIIKKELGVFLRVPGNDQQKTDLVNTLTQTRARKKTELQNYDQNSLDYALVKVVKQKSKNLFEHFKCKHEDLWDSEFRNRE